MRALWALCLLASCGGTGTVWNPPIQAELDPGYTVCETDPDCVVVQLGCCDHCNGGAAVSVNQDSLQAVSDELSEDCSGGGDCTLMGCGALTAECQQQTCVLIQDEL